MFEQMLGRGHGLRPSQLGMAVGCLAIALSVTGCGQGPTLGGETNSADPADSGDYLTPSSIYTQANDRAAAGARLEGLQNAIAKIRKETASGWIGRQDDVTGYLTELSGGTYVSKSSAPTASAVITQMMKRHGPDLFGITADDLTLGKPLTAEGFTGATVHATQTVRGVPVRDGTLLYTFGKIRGEPRIDLVRGRVFPGLSVDTEPRVSADRASDIVQRLSSASLEGPPTLVVLPVDMGRLAWEVPAGPTDNSSGLPTPSTLYYIDATTGDVSDVRPTTSTVNPGRGSGAHTQVNTFKLGPNDRDVQIKGKDPQGIMRTAHGVRTSDGVKLVDTTVPSYDRRTGKGAIVTYDARSKAVKKRDQIFTQPGRSLTITDREAIGAHAFSRMVFNYYHSRFDWNSWDGKGGELASYVHDPDPGNECNAGFGNGVMAYSPPCKLTNGTLNLVTIGIAGHEITHGVTESSKGFGLVYSGQSGALNESFSDYFGNAISNEINRRDDSSFDEESCSGFVADDVEAGCYTTPDKVLSLRYLLSGNKFDDYLRVLKPPLKVLLIDEDKYKADHGGVHSNSSIWNNALWSIRQQLAREDGTTMSKSKLVERFDEVVFLTLTQGLNSISGFVAARTALESTISRQPDNATISQISGRVFDASGICGTCSANIGLRGTPIEPDGATDVMPAINGKRIVFLVLYGYATGIPYEGTVTGTGGLTMPGGATAVTAEIAFAGDAVVALELGGRQPSVVRYPGKGKRVELESVGESARLPGLGGSDRGATWWSPGPQKINFVDPRGAITRASLPRMKGDTVTAVSTGHGTVGIGTKKGKVFLWTPGSKPRKVGDTQSAVRVTAAYGQRVMAIDDTGQALLFRAGSKKRTILSKDASPFGATMGPRSVVWANYLKDLQGGVARTERRYARDTDLFVYSFKSGKTDRKLLSQRGQQGFPSLSGRRLAWQETGLGGDDIFTTKVPKRF